VPFGPSLADAFGKPVGSEDCLSLNIWRPEGDATGLPVIVFIHGGANIAGYSADPLYHGANLARSTGTVVVTINYRLGVLGWFLDPALAETADAESASGNLGLLDIISALEFARSNVEAFGGDPGNVTLIGQSAGAVNSLALVVAPRARGLFHRVVALSGALLASPRNAQEAYAGKIVAELLMADGQAADSAAASRVLAERGPAWRRQYLRGQTGAKLVAAAGRAGGGGLPTADGQVLPTDPRAAVMAGQHMNVPILFGNTVSEGNFFVQGVYRLSDAERFRVMLGTDPDAAPSLQLGDLLKPEFASPERFATAAGAAGKVVLQLMGNTRELFAPRVPAFVMEFAWAGQPEPWRTLVGATHGMELPFLFETFGPSLYSVSFNSRNRAERERLSGALVASLNAFVRTGEPRLIDDRDLRIRRANVP
jgi:para-nitrobenzyl esterase